MNSTRFLSLLMLGVAVISCISASPIQQQRRVRTSARQVAAAAPYPAAGFRPKIPFELPNERQPKRIPISTTVTPVVTVPIEDNNEDNVEVEAPEEVQPVVPVESQPGDDQPAGVIPVDETSVPESTETSIVVDVPKQGSDITGDSPINPIGGEQPKQPADNDTEGEEEQSDNSAPEVPTSEVDVQVEVTAEVPSAEESTQPADEPSVTTAAPTLVSSDDDNTTTTTENEDENVEDSDVHTPADAYGPPDAPESIESAENEQRDGKFVRAPSAKFELPTLARAQQFAALDVPEDQRVEEVAPTDDDDGILLLEPVPTYGPPTLGDHTPALAYGIPHVGVSIDTQAVDDNEVEDLIAADIAAQQQRLQLLRNFNDLRSGRLLYVPMRAGQRQVQPVRLMRRF